MLSLYGCGSLPETSSSSTNKYIFPGDLGIYNLNEVVLAAELFKNAPVASFAYVRTEQFDPKSSKAIAETRWELEGKENQYVSAVAFTELKDSTSEKNPLGEFLLGIDTFMRGPYAPERVETSVLAMRSVVAGSLFTMIFRKQLESLEGSATHPGFDVKRQVVSISTIKGELFPLKIGKAIEFEATFRIKTQPSRGSYADEEITRKIRYEVTAVQDGYKSTLGLALPGLVYSIRESEIDPLKQEAIITELKYSEVLAWPIERIVRGHDGVAYIDKLRDWHPR